MVGEHSYHCINNKKSTIYTLCISEHVDDIITLTYQYFNMLRREGPCQWIFDECKVKYMYLPYTCNITGIMILSFVYVCIIPTMDIVGFHVHRYKINMYTTTPQSD